MRLIKSSVMPKVAAMSATLQPSLISRENVSRCDTSSGSSRAKFSITRP
ncbi:hypothetical protein [Mesorhizobium loti]|nr:hypothetical protein [Mesorhizobium loti]